MNKLYLRIITLSVSFWGISILAMEKDKTTKEQEERNAQAEKTSRLKKRSTLFENVPEFTEIDSAVESRLERLLAVMLSDFSGLEKQQALKLLDNVPQEPKDIPDILASEISAAINAYNKEASFDINLLALLNELTTGRSRAASSLPFPLQFFMSEIKSIEAYAQQFAQKVLENNRQSPKPLPQEKIGTLIASVLFIKLNPLKILAGAALLHMCVLASGPQNREFNNWFKGELCTSPNIGKYLGRGAGIYKFSPAFLIDFLGKTDFSSILDARGITYEHSEFYQRDLIKVAQNKPRTSNAVATAVMVAPKSHAKEIGQVLGLMQDNGIFKSNCEKNNPIFYAWLLSEGIGFIIKDITSSPYDHISKIKLLIRMILNEPEYKACFSEKYPDFYRWLMSTGIGYLLDFIQYSPTEYIDEIKSLSHMMKNDEDLFMETYGESHTAFCEWLVLEGSKYATGS